MATLTVRNIPEAAKARFRTVAAAHGRSMEEHLRQLIIEADITGTTRTEGVRETQPSYRATPPDGPADWITELMRIATGAELPVPQRRGSERIAPDYPKGMEPLPGESFVNHITRISRPGFDFDVERDRTPHREPRI